MEVHRGEVFYADLSPVVGSEQGGIRPVCVENFSSAPPSSRRPLHPGWTKPACPPISISGQRTPASPRTASCCWSRSARWTNTACGSAQGRLRRKTRNGSIRHWMSAWGWMPTEDVKTEKGLPVWAVPFVVLGQSSFFRVLSASWSRAYSRIFSSVCSLRICSALQASSAAMSSSTPSCTKKWVSSRWRL